MDTAEWKKRFANGNCPLCGGKLEEDSYTVVYIGVPCRKCPDCGLSFPHYFILLDEKLDFLIDEEWDFQAVVDSHLKSLDEKIATGEAAQNKRDKIKFTG